MPRFFDAEEGRGLDVVIRFDVTGIEAGTWLVVIRDGQCHVREVTVEESVTPTLTIRTPSDAWLAIMRGELNPVAGFLSLRMSAAGDLTLLHRLRTLFPSPPVRGSRSPGN